MTVQVVSQCQFDICLFFVKVFVFSQSSVARRVKMIAVTCDNPTEPNRAAQVLLCLLNYI